MDFGYLGGELTGVLRSGSVFWLSLSLFAVGLVSCSNSCNTDTPIGNESGILGSSILTDIRAEQNKDEQEAREWGSRLRKSGWSNNACNALAQANFNNFLIRAEINSGGVERTIQKLCALGSEPALQSIIEERPEIAILFADAISKGISSEILIPIVHNLPQELMNEIFMVHAHPDDFLCLVQALGNNFPTIVKARQMGFDSPERLFMYSTSPEIRTVYHQWLRDVFDNKMPVYDEDQQAVLYAFLIKITYSVVVRMENEVSFRSSFTSKIWPDFLVACKNDPIQMQMYFDVEPDNLWTVLNMPKGKEVVENWGAIGVDVLTGAGYSDDLIVRLGEMLADKSSFTEHTVNALMKFRDEPLFHRLLRRPLSGITFAAVCQKLFEAGGGYPERLDYFNDLSDSSLTAEMGSPPNVFQENLPLYYTVWEIPKKTVQGRGITIGDWTSCAIEVVFLPYDIYCLFFTGGTGNVASLPIKAGIKTTVKAVLKKSVNEAAQEALEKSIKTAAIRTIGKEALHGMAQERLSSFLGTTFVRETMKIASDKLIFNMVDLTSTVMIMSKVTNISTQTGQFIMNSGTSLLKDGTGKTWWVKLTKQVVEDEYRGMVLDHFLNQEGTQDALLWVGGKIDNFNEKQPDEDKMRLQWEQNVADWYLNNALA